ncbi:hypothetical protein J7E97_24535 [Streptomyces sp. ISL-66]|uniref:hypothetical protein n=1 Tax=Streptomyces sp. ISL-66 TaxID=2819186 RepID=UPI001BECAE1B|nr:hypothetical protein [Streptomyces sp. ISL-66]MBT2470943.1 hypothetical protein [Streptomyces sp. ISL-66]
MPAAPPPRHAWLPSGPTAAGPVSRTSPTPAPTATGLALTALTAGGLGPQDTAVAHGLRLSALVSSLYQDPALLAFLTTVLGSEVSAMRDPVE